MKILVLALSGIGDALMFTPALQFLKEAYPDSRIDVLAMFGAVRDMYERNVLVDNVIHFDFMKKGAKNSLKFVFSIRGKYDASISVYPANRKEYNGIQWLMGAKKRCGVDYLRQNVKNFGFLNNITVREDDNLHNVQENLRLCEKLTGKTAKKEPDLMFPLNDDDVRFADEFIEKNNLKNEKFLIGFHPGCATLKNHINRRWEPDKFAQLGKMIIEKYNVPVLLFGGPEEKELREYIHKKINFSKAFMVESKNLPQSAALIKHCKAFVTNDSSLMHVASAMKMNVVAIIGPTNTNYIHPWHTEHTIVSLELECAPCFYYSPKPLTCTRKDVKYKCIRELEPERVFESVAKYIERD